MRDIALGVFWLAVALVFWLAVAVLLVMVWSYVQATGWINQRFDECFGDW
jgi:hypothetical protein